MTDVLCGKCGDRLGVAIGEWSPWAERDDYDIECILTVSDDARLRITDRQTMVGDINVHCEECHDDK